MASRKNFVFDDLHNPCESKTPKVLKLETEEEIKASEPMSVTRLVSARNASRQRRRRNPTAAKGKGGGKSKNGRLPSLPPALNTVPTVSHVFRFTNSATVTSTISIGNIIGILGVQGTVVNTTAASIASTFRVKKICVWPGLPFTAGSETNAEVIWAGSAGTVKDLSIDRSIPGGVTVDRPFETSPPQGSLASFWQDGSTASSTLFSITAFQGSVVDVHVTYTIRNNQAGQSFTVATAALGALYYLYLDGSVQHKWTPVGVPATF